MVFTLAKIFFVFITFAVLVSRAFDTYIVKSSRLLDERSLGKSSFDYATHTPEIRIFSLGHVHTPSAGILPDLHKTQVFFVIASHLLHPVTNFKHSLLNDVDFVQIVLSAFRS